MRRRLVGLLLAGAALCGEAQGASDLEAQLRVEEHLLAADLVEYQEAREQERSALSDLEAVAARLDAVLSGPAPRLDDLEQIDAERAVAEAAVEVVGHRASELRLRILERVRRAAALRQEVLRGTALPGLADPITGRWRVEISAPRQEGTFDLRLAGTVVEGSFAFGEGRSGSLAGTYVGNRLRLERLDAERGLDGIFEGTVDPAAGVVRGFWTPTLLSGGAPGGAGWSAVRVAGGEASTGEGSSE
jgi:hypothetical protein